jgi:hypothetical protein
MRPPEVSPGLRLEDESCGLAGDPTIALGNGLPSAPLTHHRNLADPPPTAATRLDAEPVHPNPNRRTDPNLRRHTVQRANGLVLQRQLWRGLASGAIVGGAGLGLASSAPPRPVRGVL